MRNSKLLLISLSIIMFIMIFVVPVPAEGIEKLNEKQKVQLLKDIVEMKPFLKTGSDIKMKKFTIGKFFNKKIYEKLRGNDILGYEYDGGFKGESDVVFIKTIRTTAKTEPYRSDFFRSLKSILKNKKIRLSKSSPTEIGIALLDVEKDNSRLTMPGALVEVYFKNRRSGKYFYYRFGTGKRSGYKDAFRDIWVIVFSILGSLS